MTLTLPFAAGVADAHPTVDAENPWPGLESFRERDEPFFRGRDADAEELARRVRREGRCVVLYGQSGLGKSSLLHAGLFPRLRSQLYLPVPIRVQYEEGTPTPREQVLRDIAAHAAAHDFEAPPADPAETLWEYFHRAGHEFWSPDSQLATPLLVFDQFEEAFTLGRKTRGREARTAAFLQELGDLIEGRPSLEVKARAEADPAAFDYGRHDYKVLVVIREDFLAQLETLAASYRSLATNRMGLAPLSGRSALLVTAAGGPALVPAGVGERIVRRVAGEPDDSGVEIEKLEVDPALLSLFCSELNELRKARERDSITPDLVAGSGEDILKGFYDRSIGDLDPAMRLLVEESLLLGERRDNIALDKALRLPGVTEEAVSTLVKRRLVRRREERDGITRLELTHDVLTPVVARSRDRRHAEEEAADAAARERAEAERLKAEADRLAAEERAAAEAARKEASSARARSRVFATLLTGMIVLSGVAVSQKRSADQARATVQRALDRLRAEKLRSDSLRLDADQRGREASEARDSAQASAGRARKSDEKARQALAALTDTANIMRAAQENVRQKALEAAVLTETANQFLDITGQMQTRQVVQDSLRQDQMQRFDQLDQARAEARRILGSLQPRLAALEASLCDDNASRSARTPNAAVDSTLVRARALVNRRLRSDRLPPLTCAPAEGAQAPPKAP